MDGRPINVKASMVRTRLGHDVERRPARPDSVISLSTSTKCRAPLKRDSQDARHWHTEAYYSPAYERLLIYVSYLSGGYWVDRHSGQSRYRECRSGSWTSFMAASRIGSRRELSDGRRPLRGVRHRAEAARTRQVEMVCSHDRHVRLGMQSRRRPYPDDWCSPNGDSVAFAIDLPSQSSHRALASSRR